MVLWSGPSRSWGPLEQGECGAWEVSGRPSSRHHLHPDSIFISVAIRPHTLLFSTFTPRFLCLHNFLYLSLLFILISWVCVSGKQTKMLVSGSQYILTSICFPCQSFSPAHHGSCSRVQMHYTKFCRIACSDDFSIAVSQSLCYTMACIHQTRDVSTLPHGAF